MNRNRETRNAHHRRDAREQERLGYAERRMGAAARADAWRAYNEGRGERPSTS